MYKEFYGLKEQPFSLLPDPDFLFLSKQHKKALTMLEYSLASQAGFTVISGDIGAGKTTLIRKHLRNLSPEITVGLLNNTQCNDISELLRWIAFSFELDFEGKEHVELYDIFVHFLINEYSEGRRCILVIDEAQQLGIEMLEQIRLLSNINSDTHLLLQIILVGQPELRDILRDPRLEQFAQRIAVDFHLRPLSCAEVLEYIGHRLSVAGGDSCLFSKKSSELIWRHSRGIPRLVNIISDKVLVYGFSEQIGHIDEELVQEVIDDHAMSLAPVQEKIGAVSANSAFY